jgi:hypothetical protein
MRRAPWERQTGLGSLAKPEATMKRKARNFFKMRAYCQAVCQTN